MEPKQFIAVIFGLIMSCAVLAQDIGGVSSFTLTSNDRRKLNQIIDRSNNMEDTADVFRVDINKNIDSLGVHLDTLQDLRSDVNGYQTFFRSDSIVVGAIRFSNTVWDDLRVPLTNTKLTPTKSEPVFEDIGNGVNAYGFDADADSTEALHFAAQLPHGYALGEDIEVHIHWLPATTNTGNVKWKFRWRMAAINDTLMTIDSLYIVDAADGVALKHQLADFGDITGDSLGISAMIIGNVSRCGEDAEDTFTGTAYGVEIDFHVPFTDFGSPEEEVKDY